MASVAPRVHVERAVPRAHACPYGDGAAYMMLIFLLCRFVKCRFKKLS